MGLGYLTGVLGGHPCKNAWIGLIRPELMPLLPATLGLGLNNYRITEPAAVYAFFFPVCNDPSTQEHIDNFLFLPRPGTIRPNMPMFNRFFLSPRTRHGLLQKGLGTEKISRFSTISGISRERPSLLFLGSWVLSCNL